MRLVRPSYDCGGGERKIKSAKLGTNTRTSLPLPCLERNRERRKWGGVALTRTVFGFGEAWRLKEKEEEEAAVSCK